MSQAVLNVKPHSVLTKMSHFQSLNVFFCHAILSLLSIQMLLQIFNVYSYHGYSCHSHEAVGSFTCLYKTIMVPTQCAVNTLTLLTDSRRCSPDQRFFEEFLGRMDPIYYTVYLLYLCTLNLFFTFIFNPSCNTTDVDVDNP